MKQHELNRMFNALTPSPEREKALLEKLLQNDKRRETSVKNWKRIAVCVAVAALLMTCTVGAVATVTSFFKMEVKEESKGVYWLSGGITYYPLDSLSDELKALDGQGPEDLAERLAERIPFDSWERVEEFIGLDVMNNPVLEGTGTEIPFSEMNLSYNGKGRFEILTDKDLKKIDIFEDYQIGEVHIHVDQDIYTDRMTQEDRQHNTLYGYDFSGSLENGSEITEETYVAPNGLETLLVMTDRVDNDVKGDCVATVSLNGIRTGIVVNSPNSVKEARDVMIQILNAFTP